ncbi:putative leucine-rich repeat receptor-like protein kinase [Senna tora]|uniref:Putative leucine-rich repeat receptor-like protein kinase n=1 Tax=Senna tora TaxID=362788 RepID=A0A834W8G9_9FABA|nr:putative leucine-rich repeat receptor-like protein kinase [Senna tora]
MSSLWLMGDHANLKQVAAQNEVAVDRSASSFSTTRFRSFNFSSSHILDIAWIICHPIRLTFFYDFPHPTHHFLPHSPTLVHFFPFAANNDYICVCEGFISIDCGANVDHVDDSNGIWYERDDKFIGSGSNYEISPDIRFDNSPTVNGQILTLRSFPEGERNCYTLKPKPKQEMKQNQKNSYLIRAVFSYGNYDNKNRVPVFHLYLGVNYWKTIQLPDDSYYEYQDIILHHDHLYSTDNILQVCLVNIERGTPFINSLELRPLNNSIYNSNNSTIYLMLRYDIGSGLPSSITRYKDDMYDRLWKYYDFIYLDRLNTSEEIKTEDSAYKVPPQVLRSAVQSLNRSYSIYVNWTYETSQQYLVFLHFAEVEKLPSGHKRIINVTFGDNNDYILQPLDYLKPVTLCPKNPTKGYVTFTISAAAESDAPPILNAFEVAQLLPQPNSPTHPQDGIYIYIYISINSLIFAFVLLCVGVIYVNAIMEIKGTYEITRISWQGDPCLPSILAWDGLNCSSDKNPRIISLNLSSSKLTGQITTSFANLEKLELLDLSNNELTGQLPEILANLSNLKFLNLAGNKLTGSIPNALREKANLQLRFACLQNQTF